MFREEKIFSIALDATANEERAFFNFTNCFILHRFASRATIFLFYFPIEGGRMKKRMKTRRKARGENYVDDVEEKNYSDNKEVVLPDIH
jgi:hypothetical protein